MKKLCLRLLVTGCLLLLACGPPVLAQEPGDELIVIEHKETSWSDRTPCQLTVTAEVPDGFGLHCYAELGGPDGLTYRVSLSEENGYSDHIFLQGGIYTLTGCGVYGDNIGEYTFMPSARKISLTEAESASLLLSLEQYGAVEEQIEGIRSPSAAQKGSFFPTGLDGVMGDEEGYLHYEMSEDTPAKGVSITGNADGAYDILVAIESSGVIGEASYSVSLDSGQSVLSEGITDSDVPVGHGMVLHFWTADDNDEFAAGDVYSVHVYETFTATNPAPPYVLCEGSPSQNHSLTLRILSPGRRGISKFTLAEGKDAVYTGPIPEDGIYRYADDLSVVFADGTYEKNKTYEIHVRSHHKQTDYTPLYILCAAVAAAWIGVYMILAAKKERLSAYALRPWKMHKEEADYE